MGEIITTFGIFLAVFTYIESLYHESIDKALNIKVEKHSSDNRLGYKIVKKTINSKQTPLLILALTITILMLPISYDLIITTIDCIISKTGNYNIIVSGLLFINACFIIISIIQIKKTYLLRKKLSKLAK